jgi:hypothetical protein
MLTHLSYAEWMEVLGIAAFMIVTLIIAMNVAYWLSERVTKDDDEEF